MGIIIKIDGLSHGPYSLDEVRSMILEGKVGPDHEAMILGQHIWMPLSNVPGIKESQVAIPTAAKSANPLQVSKPLNNQSPVRKVSILLGLGIFLFPYAFSWFTLRSGYSTLSRVLSFVWLACTILFVILNPPPQNQNNPSGSSQQKALVDNSEPVSSISWQQVDSIYNLKSSSTDIQKRDAWKGFKGKRVVWSGEVTEISDGLLTGLTLQIKMNSDTLTSDLLIRLKKSERDKAGQVSKGRKVTFSGVLNDWGTILPITIDDGEIIR